MLANQASHLEHGHLHFPEDFFELGICVDHALVDRILQLVLFNVNPQLLHNFSASQWVGTHNGCQRGAWC